MATTTNDISKIIEAETAKHEEQERAWLRNFLNTIDNRLWLVIPEDMPAGEFEKLMQAIERHCKEVAVKRVTTESKQHWTVELYECFGNRVGLIIKRNVNYDINNALTKVEIITGNEAWEKTLEDTIEDVDEEIADLQGFRETLKETAKQLELSIMDWDELRKELGKEEEE
jgi:hypothetical protein